MESFIQHYVGQAEQLTTEQFQQFIDEICQRKCDDFAMLGYQGIAHTDILQCVLTRYAKSDWPDLHELVEDVVSLQINDYMTWRSLSVYK
jgi:hypothetical protein